MKKSISFPIILLQLNKEPKELLSCIMNYAIIDYIKKNIEYTVYNEYLVVDSIDNNSEYREIEFKKYPQNECEEINIIAGELYQVLLTTKSINIYEETKDFLSYNKKGNKNFVYTNVAWQLFKEVYFDNKITYRELKVILAINSILGNKLYNRITYSYILARYHGYEKKAEYETDIQNGIIKPEITERQLRYTIDKLYEKNFFRIITYRNREIYFSTYFKSQEQLIKAIGEKKAEIQMRKKSKSNRTFSDQIDSIKQSKLKLIKKVV